MQQVQKFLLNYLSNFHKKFSEAIRKGPKEIYIRRIKPNTFLPDELRKSINFSLKIIILGDRKQNFPVESQTPLTEITDPKIPNSVQEPQTSLKRSK